METRDGAGLPALAGSSGGRATVHVLGAVSGSVGCGSLPPSPGADWDGDAAMVFDSGAVVGSEGVAASPLRDGAHANSDGVGMEGLEGCAPGVCGIAATESASPLQSGGGKAAINGTGSIANNVWSLPSGSFAIGRDGKLMSTGPTNLGANSRSGQPQGLANAWGRPPVVAFPSRAEIGGMTMRDGVIRLRQEVLQDSTKNFEAALVGRLFGRKIPYEFLSKELRRRWDRFGNFKLVMDWKLQGRRRAYLYPKGNTPYNYLKTRVFWPASPQNAPWIPIPSSKTLMRTLLLTLWNTGD